MEYSKIVLAHRILVSLFLLHYVIKLILLLINKKEVLGSYTKATKVPEMAISALFLITGFYLVFVGPALHTLQTIKIVFVLASIPIAVIGFKKANKALAILSVVLLLAAYGLAEVAKKKMRTAVVDTTAIADEANPLEVGKVVYDQQCSRCHGEKGDAEIAGAKNLRLSVLSDEEAAAIITKGKGTMPAFESLTESQSSALVQYINTFKQQ
jgi:mono/diheme cytochrome c family protein